MKPRVLIVAAPFGFGPAAKALILAHGLKDLADLTLFADREAWAFMDRHKPLTVASRCGIFGQVFSDRAALQEYDQIVSINHVPALVHLQALGLAKRTCSSTACWPGGRPPRAPPCRPVFGATWCRTTRVPRACSIAPWPSRLRSLHHCCGRCRRQTRSHSPRCGAASGGHHLATGQLGTGSWIDLRAGQVGDRCRRHARPGADRDGLCATGRSGPGRRTGLRCRATSVRKARRGRSLALSVLITTPASARSSRLCRRTRRWSCCRL
jgi:hypothetical protein